MPQTFEQSLKAKLGDILYQAFQLSWENDQLREQNRELMARLPKPKTAKEPRDG
jgi:type II secretory pathway component PulL